MMLRGVGAGTILEAGKERVENRILTYVDVNGKK